MRLEEWLEANNKAPSRLAVEADVAPSQVLRYLSGERGITPETARRLSEATGGQVGILELLFDEEETDDDS